MRGTLKPTALAFLAAGLAIVADTLLRGAAWGVNIGLLALIVAFACVWLGRRSPLQLTRTGQWLGGLALVFAAMFAFRDSNSLKVANGTAIVLLVGAMLLPVSDRVLRESNVVRLLIEPFGEWFKLPVEAYQLGEKARKEIEVSNTVRHKGNAIARGLLIATPLILVFGGLFASADAVFRTKITDMFAFTPDVEGLAAHAATLSAALFLLGGLLYRLFLREGPSAPPIAREIKVPGVGIIEVGIVLSSLNALFAAFLAVQFRYLFGANDVVQATHGLSFAEYARGGFFELVAVAALALTVLLTANSILKREGPRDQTAYQWLGRALVVMVFCVVASAMLRMKLYTALFGLTELRVYSTVFMVWLSLAFAWLLATTLNRRPQNFVFGAFLGGLLTIFGANILDPDRLIVRTNLTKLKTDFAYLKTLSDDATLALEDSTAIIPSERRKEFADFVQSRKAELAKDDWRELNLSRWMLMR